MFYLYLKKIAIKVSNKGVFEVLKSFEKLAKSEKISSPIGAELQFPITESFITLYKTHDSKQ